MRIIADTNVLVRAAVTDNPARSSAAADSLTQAEAVAMTLPTLCEFVWVLRRGYRESSSRVASAVRKLIESTTVLVDRPAVEAGLIFLDRGGDFADGVIAFEGLRLGGQVFTSFDQTAVRLVEATRGEARLLPTR